jgi:hypothetical protein
MMKKKKMQEVSFRNIEEMLDYLPEDQLELVEILRELIHECLPNIKEKLSFNVPFYRRFGRICYVWPGAVAWGSKTSPGVEIGFNQGYLLGEVADFLETGNRKQVRTKRFLSPTEIDFEQLRICLFAAADLDEQLHLEKKTKKPGKTKL